MPLPALNRIGILWTSILAQEPTRLGARRNSGTSHRLLGRQARPINLGLEMAILGLRHRDVCKRAYPPAKWIAPQTKSVKIIQRCQNLSHEARLGPIHRASSV